MQAEQRIGRLDPDRRGPARPARLSICDRIRSMNLSRSCRGRARAPALACTRSIRCGISATQSIAGRTIDAMRENRDRQEDDARRAPAASFGRHARAARTIRASAPARSRPPARRSPAGRIRRPARSANGSASRSARCRRSGSAKQAAGRAWPRASPRSAMRLSDCPGLIARSARPLNGSDIRA